MRRCTRRLIILVRQRTRTLHRVSRCQHLLARRHVLLRRYLARSLLHRHVPAHLSRPKPNRYRESASSAPISSQPSAKPIVSLILPCTHEASLQRGGRRTHPTPALPYRLRRRRLLQVVDVWTCPRRLHHKMEVATFDSLRHRRIGIIEIAPIAGTPWAQLHTSRLLPPIDEVLAERALLHRAGRMGRRVELADLNLKIILRVVANQTCEHPRRDKP